MMISCPAFINVGGVYALVNINKNKWYIGETRNFKTRYEEHRRHMREGNHKTLQNDVNEGNKFLFIILEIMKDANKQERVDRETEYIKEYKEIKNCYNSHNGLSPTEETKNKISETMKNLHSIREDRGKAEDAERIEGFHFNQGSNNGWAKLNDEKVIDIVKMLKSGKLVKDVMEKYNVTYSCVRKIKNGTTWKHITKGPIK